MASLLPEKNTESTEVANRLSLQKMAVAEAMAYGQTSGDIARRIGKGDKLRAKAWRQKIRMWVRRDAEYQAYLVEAANGILLEGLGSAAKALVRRAARGNPQATKLLFEATNFHNPKVKHEHSGEVKVKLEVGGQVSSAPRPAPVEDVVDAEVVE